MADSGTGFAVKRTGQEAELYRAAQAFRNQLLSHEELAVGRMREVYAAAMSDLQKELAAFEVQLANRVASGRPVDDLAYVMRARLYSLIDQTEKRLAETSESAVGIVSDGQQTALNFVNSRTGDLFAAATGDKDRAVSITGAFDYLPVEAIESFVGFSSDGSPLAVLFDSIAQETPNSMRLALASGIASGAHPLDVAARLTGLASLPTVRAETIARTEMLRAAREAQRRQYEYSPGITGYRRMATQDSRVCLACLALSGTLHKTSEIMPTHPNCRCVMIPVTKSLAELVGDPTIPDLRPGAVTPEMLMAGIAEPELRRIFGNKRYELHRSGYPLSQMVDVRMDARWGPTTRIKPIRELNVG